MNIPLDFQIKSLSHQPFSLFRTCVLSLSSFSLRLWTSRAGFPVNKYMPESIYNLQLCTRIITNYNLTCTCNTDNEIWSCSITPTTAYLKIIIFLKIGNLKEKINVSRKHIWKCWITALGRNSTITAWPRFNVVLCQLQSSSTGWVHALPPQNIQELDLKILLGYLKLSTCHIWLVEKGFLLPVGPTKVTQLKFLKAKTGLGKKAVQTKNPWNPRQSIKPKLTENLIQNNPN